MHESLDLWHWPFGRHPLLRKPIQYIERNGARADELPQGYVSGSPLSDTSTYDAETLASLGATPGTYVWTWGSAAADDTFTLQIGPAVPVVPEPSSFALLGGGLGLLGLISVGTFRRRSSG
jgi:hypothetical protein